MTDPRLPHLPDTDPTAAELSLGLLEGDERAAALRRLLAEREFAAEVAGWDARFAGMFATWPEADPPLHGLERLERALDENENRGASSRVRVWKRLTALSTAVAACLLVFLVVQPRFEGHGDKSQPNHPAALLIAAIEPVDGGSPIAAAYDPVSNSMSIAPAALAGAGHSAELWVVGADQMPHPLGLLDRSATTRIAIAIDARPFLDRQAVLAVSLEPEGGSPTGKPTGPILAKGSLS